MKILALMNNTKEIKLKSKSDTLEILKTILIFTIISCFITGLIALIYIYGCQPVQGAEIRFNQRFNQKFIEVSKQRTRAPSRARWMRRKETVLIAPVVPTVYAPPVVVPSSSIPAKVNACAPADGQQNTTEPKREICLPVAPVKVRTRSVIR